MYAQNPGTGFTIWITGMQGSGKSALAREVVNRLKRLNKAAELLEGPEWDVFIGKGPGETKEERNAIVRRAGFVARALTRAGGFVVVPQVSPIRETREGLRREIGRFLEVFVDAPFHTLLQRDSAGLYKKAMSGEIPNFIGVTDPYEPPANPEVKYDSSKLAADDAATMVLEALVREGALQPSDIGMSKVPPAPETEESEEPPAPILFTPEMLKLPKPQPRPEGKAAPVKAAPAAAAKAPAKADSKAAPAKASKAAGKPAKEPKAARSRAEAKEKEPAKPARARAVAPVKAARKKSAAKTARASKPAAPAKAAKKAAAKPAPKKAPAKAKKGKR